jgi:hypothetical protein
VIALCCWSGNSWLGFTSESLLKNSADSNFGWTILCHTSPLVNCNPRPEYQLGLHFPMTHAGGHPGIRYKSRGSTGMGVCVQLGSFVDRVPNQVRRGGQTPLWWYFLWFWTDVSWFYGSAWQPHGRCSGPIIFHVVIHVCGQDDRRQIRFGPHHQLPSEHENYGSQTSLFLTPSESILYWRSNVSDLCSRRWLSVWGLVWSLPCVQWWRDFDTIPTPPILWSSPDKSLPLPTETNCVLTSPTRRLILLTKRQPERGLQTPPGLCARSWLSINHPNRRIITFP